MDLLFWNFSPSTKVNILRWVSSPSDCNALHIFLALSAKVKKMNACELFIYIFNTSIHNECSCNHSLVLLCIGGSLWPTRTFNPIWWVKRWIQVNLVYSVSLFNCCSSSCSSSTTQVVGSHGVREKGMGLPLISLSGYIIRTPGGLKFHWGASSLSFQNRRRRIGGEQLQPAESWLTHSSVCFVTEEQKKFVTIPNNTVIMWVSLWLKKVEMDFVTQFSVLEKRVIRRESKEGLVEESWRSISRRFKKRI